MIKGIHHISMKCGTAEVYIVRKTTRIFAKNNTKKNMQMFG